ncbi:MAG: outer membrane protein transport protein, partial [Pseudomonadota bacterium]|nr:outer membrane protein transport protein [Pseudomonadota bacterium]
MRLNHYIKRVGLALGASVFALSAQAQLATNLLIDPVAMSLGNAVTASPPGLSGVHFNPAALANIKGRHIQFNFLAAMLEFESEYSAGDDYEFFGYSDDPVVCEQPGENGSCAKFKTTKSKTRGISAIIPLRDRFLDLPPGPLVNPLLLPSIAIRAPDSKYTFASGISAPLAAGYYRDPDDVGNFMGQRVGLLRVNYLTPSVGFDITDELSVGATINFAYQALGFESDVRSPNDLTGMLRYLHESVCTPFDGEGNLVTDIFLFGLCNSDDSIGPFSKLADLRLVEKDTLSPNFHLGVMWEPTRDFSWGAVFQSAAQVDMSGQFRVRSSQEIRNAINAIGSSPTGAIALQILGIPVNIPEEQMGTVTQRFSFPAHFQTGIKYRLFDQVGLSFDVGWSNYSEWDNINLR